jgi:predicted PurR-regulated permease PerM
MLPNWSNRQIIWATVTVAAVALLFWLIYRYNETILLVVSGIIIAIAVRPIVRRLKNLGVPQGVGVGLVYLVLLLALVLFAVYGIPLIASQSATIVERTRTLYTDFYTLLTTTENYFLRRLLTALPSTLGAPTTPEPVAPDAITSVNDGLLVLQNVGGILLKILATLAMAFFWTVESERIKQVLLLLVPIGKRPDAKETVNNIEEIVGNYTVGQGILMAIIGVAQGIVYAVVGLPYAFLLAIIAGIGEAIPLIGPLLGTIPAIAVALTISPTTALIVGVAAIIIQQVENTILVPRIMGNAVGAQPIPTMLAFIAFSSLFGFVGALITVPVTATIQLIVDRLIFSRSAGEAQIANGGRTKLSLIRYELNDLIQDVKSQIRRKEEVATAAQDQIEDSIEAIALDLDSVLAKVEKGDV